MMMEIKVKNLKGNGIPVTFGPISTPEKFKIDLLSEAYKRLEIGTMDFNEFSLVIGDRLGENPYPVTDRATMPPNYLCEGSVWVNLYSPDGRYGNIALVPHLHRSDAHHNFWLYWTDFDGSKDSDNQISGHQIPINEPVVVSIRCGAENRKGTISVKSFIPKREEE